MKTEKLTPRASSNPPILFVVFNRPDTTRLVFEAIRQARPEKLFVAADGPRSDYPGEVDKCRLVREIATSVDWECELKVLFREQNLGCQVAISSAINWFFQHVDEGIILEDDCKPNASFFPFCQELLERYRYDKRIFLISGANFQHGRKRTEYSYYFSHFAQIWGWATWKRAWDYFDFDMTLWPLICEGKWTDDIWPKSSQKLFWINHLNSINKGRLNSWALRWAFTVFANNALSILPNVNLVSNIGFGNESGVHTTTKNSLVHNLPAEQLTFPLKHPPFMIRDKVADDYTYKTLYSSSFLRRIKNKIKKIIDRG